METKEKSVVGAVAELPKALINEGENEMLPDSTNLHKLKSQKLFSMRRRKENLEMEK